MLETLLRTVKQNDLIVQGDRIVIGLSGGPDSLAMTHALLQLKTELEIELFAVHVNHQFRGELADADEAFVIKYCADNDIPCFSFRIDVPLKAKEMGLSFEEAGRVVRYQKFEAVKKEVSATKIAVAQNKNDTIETFFINLFRGAGIDGLASIDYKRDGTYIRPLLDVDRSCIETYCEQHMLMPRRDHTNDENDYVRNKIRNEFLPYVRNTFNSSIDDSIQKTIHIMKAEKEFWSSHQKDLFKALCKVENEEVLVDFDAFAKLQEAERYQLIRFCIKQLRGSLTNLSFDTIVRCAQLTRTGALCELDKEFSVRRSYEHLVFYKNDSSKASVTHDLVTKIIPIDERNKYAFNRFCIAIDADSIKGSIKVRTRKEGDLFIPFGMNGHKKIKDFFIDEKVPFRDRDKILLICDEEKIIWVKDMRMSDSCKITQDTKNIMIMTFQELVERK